MGDAIENQDLQVLSHDEEDEFPGRANTDVIYIM